jgi:uncharacterized membrane protein
MRSGRRSSHERNIRQKILFESANMTDEAQSLIGAETIVDMTRVGGLSDAVFAVALTLLVLDIRIPDATTLAGLPERLLELAPRLLVYLIGFIIIGGAWASHQRMIGQIERGDGPLAWLNLLSLLFVTLIPASASLLGRFPTSFLAIVLFALNVILVQLSAFLMWRHAERRRMINARLDPRVISAVGRRLALSTGVFVVAVPIAWLNPVIAYVLWIGWFTLMFTTDWLSWQDAYKTTRESFLLDGASRARIRLVHAGGRLQLSANDTDDIVAGGLFGGGLDAAVTRDDTGLNLRLRPGSRPGFMSARYPWAWSPVNAFDWDLGLSKMPTIDLEIETGGGQGSFDLSELRIESLSLTTSATSTSIMLPKHLSQVHVEIEAAASSLVLKVPEGVAASIFVKKAMANAEVDLARFPSHGVEDEYRSPNYESASRRVEVRLRLGLGSVRIV